MNDTHARKAQLLARGLLESPEVYESLKRRLLEGTLPEEVELLLWELAYPPAGHHPAHESTTSMQRRPTLAFKMPLSDDERQARISAAALDGDVAAVAALTQHQERKP